jgi:hypothetical protein
MKTEPLSPITTGLDFAYASDIVEDNSVNTKNWYRKETDLWAEFGRGVPFGRRFPSTHSVKALAVGSASSFGKRVVPRLKAEMFGSA